MHAKTVGSLQQATSVLTTVVGRHTSVEQVNTCRGEFRYEHELVTLKGARSPIAEQRFQNRARRSSVKDGLCNTWATWLPCSTQTVSNQLSLFLEVCLLFPELLHLQLFPHALCVCSQPRRGSPQRSLCCVINKPRRDQS